MKQGIWEYIKRYGLKSIFLRCICVVTVILTVPLICITILVQSVYKEVIKKDLYDAYTRSLTKTADLLDTVFSNVEQLAITLTVNEDIEKTWRYSESKALNYETLRQHHKVNSLLNNMLILSPYIESIYIYYENLNLVHSTNYGTTHFEEFPDNNWHSSYAALPFDSKLHPMIRRRYIKDSLDYKSEPMLSFMKKVNKEINGYGFVFDVKLQKIQELLNTLDDREMVFLVDNNNQIVFDEGLNYLNRPIDEVIQETDSTYDHIFKDSIRFKGDLMVKYSMPFREEGWKLISLVSVEALERQIKWLDDLLWFAILSVSLFSIGISWLISRWLYSSFRILAGAVNGEIRLSDTSLAGLSSYGELNEVTEKIQNFWTKNEEIQQELESSLHSLYKTQIISLQSQITPHFLFNTLENVCWKARGLTGGDNEVVDMIGKLSEMIRLSMAQSSILTTIEDELYYMDLYIDIMQKRYTRKFKVEKYIDDSLATYKIPKFTIQPLVENAITHGSKGIKRQEDITVTIQEEQSDIVIKVKDNGAGMKPEVLRELIQSLELESKDSHIGLYNVHRRIQLVFGKEYGASIYSEQGIGTEITLRLPKNKLE